MVCDSGRAVSELQQRARSVCVSLSTFFIMNSLDEESNDGSLDVGHGILLGKIDKFCYLGNMLDADR